MNDTAADTHADPAPEIAMPVYPGHLTLQAAAVLAKQIAHGIAVWIDDDGELHVAPYPIPGGDVPSWLRKQAE